MNYEKMLSSLQAKGAIARRQAWTGGFSHVGQITNWNGDAYPNTQNFRFQPFLYMRDGLGNIRPWTPTGMDITANDWQIIYLDAATPVIQTHTLNEALEELQKMPMNVRQPRLSRLAWQSNDGSTRWIRRFAPFSDPEFSMREEAYSEGTLMQFLLYKDAKNALYPLNPNVHLTDADRLADDWAIHHPAGIKG